jgi:hypothetical protein
MSAQLLVALRPAVRHLGLQNWKWNFVKASCSSGKPWFILISEQISISSGAVHRQNWRIRTLLRACVILPVALQVVWAQQLISSKIERRQTGYLFYTRRTANFCFRFSRGGEARSTPAAAAGCLFFFFKDIKVQCVKCSSIRQPCKHALKELYMQVRGRLFFFSAGFFFVFFVTAPWFITCETNTRKYP